MTTKDIKIEVITHTKHEDLKHENKSSVSMPDEIIGGISFEDFIAEVTKSDADKRPVNREPDDPSAKSLANLINEEDSEELSTSSIKHQEVVRNLELETKTRNIAAPSIDADVKLALRSHNLPICLFGEGPYERRHRLRHHLAQIDLTPKPKVPSPPATSPAVLYHPATLTASPAATAQDQDVETFYTEGSAELKQIRIKLTNYSIPRSLSRLKRERQYQQSIDPLDEEDNNREFMNKLKNSVHHLSSQVCDDRPLTIGRFSSDNQYFATGSWSPEVSLWHVRDAEKYKTLRGHKSRVHGIAWSPLPSSYNPESDTINNIATGSADSSIILWNCHSATQLHTLTGHEDRINRLAYHPSGDYLLSTSNDDTWRFWDIETAKEIYLQEGHCCATYSLVIHPDGALVVVGDVNGDARVWDIRSGKIAVPLKGHVKTILSTDIHPRTPHLIATSSEDHSVRLWDLRKARSIVTLLAHNSIVSECLFERVRGRYLVTGSFDKLVKVWSLPVTGDHPECVKYLPGHESRVMSADLTSDGSMISSVSFDRTWKMWQIDSKLFDTS